VIWQPEGADARGFSLAYQSVVMHAVSRDTSSFHSPCLYLQIDAEHKIASATGAMTASMGSVTDVPMDVCDEPPSVAATVGPGGEEKGDDDDADDDDVDDDEEEEAQELRVVPVGTEAGGAGMDATLERLFAALSACAALNPDPDDSEDEDEGTFDGDFDGEEGGAAVLGAQGFEAGDDPQALLAGASPAQLAMLARFDAMLEAQDMQNPSGGGAEPQNQDGRFDDAEDDGNVGAK
jgi:hypothetical protein